MVSEKIPSWSGGFNLHSRATNKPAEKINFLENRNFTLRDVSYGLPEWNLEDIGGYMPLHRFAVTQRNLFKEVPPISGVRPALRRLSKQGVRIRIITHRLFIKYFHKTAVGQTIDWLD